MGGEKKRRGVRVKERKKEGISIEFILYYNSVLGSFSMFTHFILNIDLGSKFLSLLYR